MAHYQLVNCLLADYASQHCFYSGAVCGNGLFHTVIHLNQFIHLN